MGAVAESALVRVGLVSGTRTADLVVPGAVPVAELLPELVRRLGLLDAVTVPGGYLLFTVDGRELSGSAGLLAQGVRDGALLTVAVGADRPPPTAYDDPVELVARAVEDDLAHWSAASGRRTTAAAGAVLLVAGALGLLAQPAAGLAATTLMVVASGLVAGVWAASRRGRPDSTVPVALAWLAVAYAATAGAIAMPGRPWPLGAGVGACVAGVATVAAVAAIRRVVAPAAMAGAVLVMAGAVAALLDVEAPLVLAVVLVLVVVVGDLLPWLGLTAAGIRATPLGGGSAPAAGVDPEPVAAGVRAAHRHLVGLSGGAGVLLVACCPATVSLGGWGATLALAGCLVVLARTRRHVARAQVLVGVLSGFAGVLATGVAAWWQHPGWRLETAVALVGAGALMLLVALSPGGSAVRRGRIAEVVEAVGLVSLAPLLALATGVPVVVRGLVG